VGPSILGNSAILGTPYLILHFVQGVQERSWPTKDYPGCVELILSQLPEQGDLRHIWTVAWCPMSRKNGGFVKIAPCTAAVMNWCDFVSTKSAKDAI